MNPRAKHAGGRPRKEINWIEFEQLCFLQCTMLEMCEWFHITDKTLTRRVREHYNQSFSEVFERKRVGGKISLRRNLFTLSQKNPIVAIHLSKHWLGMKDKLEIGGDDGGPIKHDITIKVVDEETRKATEEILKRKGVAHGSKEHESQ